MIRLLQRPAAVALAIALLGAAPPMSGTFALQTGRVMTQSFLRAAPVGGNTLDEHLDLWMTRRGSTQPITQYTIDMERLIHLIVISDDFKWFAHVHPSLGKDGHFTIDQRFPAKGLYHIYVDAEPFALDNQVFRFDLSLGAGPASARALTRTGKTVTTGAYTVNLSGTTVHAGHMSMLVVHVLKDGKPATDLHPYLGMLAHAVFVDGSDLSYTHVHPMSMNMDMSSMRMDQFGEMEMKPLPDNGSTPPDMMLHIDMKEAGMYKLWLQFRGGNDLYVAPFTINVR